MYELKRVDEGGFEALFSMMKEFYTSPAVEHDVDAAVLERTARAIIDPTEPLVWGYLILEEGAVVGYLYLAESYAGEVGGRSLMLEEIYLNDACRGKGYATKIISDLKDRYPDHKRFRLEVTPANEGAARLYERLGFRRLTYDNMVFDRDE